MIPRVQERRGRPIRCPHRVGIRLCSVVKLLFIGDIVARPGRELVKRHLKALAATLSADVVIANGENAAAGAGITREHADEILKRAWM